VQNDLDKVLFPHQGCMQLACQAYWPVCGFRTALAAPGLFVARVRLCLGAGRCVHLVRPGRCGSACLGCAASARGLRRAAGRDEEGAAAPDTQQTLQAQAVGLGVAGAANLRQNVELRQQQAEAFASKLPGVICGMQAQAMPQRAMVAEPNTLGVKTSTGCVWNLGQLQRIIKRLERVTKAEGGSWRLA
jgi:hypothetical protein